MPPSNGCSIVVCVWLKVAFWGNGLLHNVKGKFIFESSGVNYRIMALYTYGTLARADLLMRITAEEVSANVLTSVCTSVHSQFARRIGKLPDLHQALEQFSGSLARGSSQDLL